MVGAPYENGNVALLIGVLKELASGVVLLNVFVSDIETYKIYWLHPPVIGNCGRLQADILKPIRTETFSDCDKRGESVDKYKSPATSQRASILPHQKSIQRLEWIASE